MSSENIALPRQDQVFLMLSKKLHQSDSPLIVTVISKTVTRPVAVISYCASSALISASLVNMTN